MIPIAKLINEGFEIKAATTYEVQGVTHQSIILQRANDVFVCIFRMSANGSFTQAGGGQLG
jgi:hypothetical protein